MHCLLTQLQAWGLTQGLGTQNFDREVTHLLRQLLKQVLRQLKMRELDHLMTQVLGPLAREGVSVAWQLIW